MSLQNRKTGVFPVTNLEQFKEKVLSWALPFSTFCFLDNNGYRTGMHAAECLLAAGARQSVSAPAGQALETLREFRKKTGGWLFGHLGYDLKNEMENLSSGHPDLIGFPDLFFFEPEIIVHIQDGLCKIEAPEPGAVFAAISSMVIQPVAVEQPAITVQSRFSRREYLDVIHALQRHISRGDCYEINFCQEFFAEDARIDPYTVFKELNRLSPNPFSALYRMNDKWLLCASPERFLRKEGDRLLSQPIKGTARRAPGNAELDRHIAAELQQNAKERSENVMVVDLVRNDLSRICLEGTVKVDELFGVYAFPQVFQLISTISGQLRPGTGISEIVRAVFPMGSMTGAPKKKVMELIEKYEKTKRGVFSGAVGYISPSDDFDFNVVIRSILYNAGTRYLSFQTGSGITHYSQAEAEWEECRLKAAAIRQVLGAG